MAPTQSVLKRILKGVGILFLILIVLFGFHRTMLALSEDHRIGPFAQTSCGAEHQGGKRILVAYDSKYGSTGEVAVAIGETLCEEGFKADVRLVGNVDKLEGYDAAVVGSPIYNGRWMGSATDFLKRHEDGLAKIRVAFFIIGNIISTGKNTPENRATARNWFIRRVADDFPKIKLIDNYGMFGGKLKTSQLTGYERFIMWVMGEVDGDSRDFGKIKEWAREIAPSLAGGK